MKKSKSSHILIIDAGGTSTNLALLHTDDSIIDTKDAPGINATQDDLERSLPQILKPYQTVDIGSVYFYGAGCINHRIKDRIAQIIHAFLSSEDINVNDDLLGAARGLLGREKGLISILGTGSNIGYYDGEQIIDQISPGGYLLGDEGSGFQIGREIYLRYMRRQLSKSTLAQLENVSKIKSQDAVLALYKTKKPKDTLATWARYFSKLNDEERRRISKIVFSKYIDEMAWPMYQKYSCDIAITGSVGYHLKDYLEPLLIKKDIGIAKISSRPIDGLIKYHQHLALPA